MTATTKLETPNWTAQLLPGPPAIAPARRYIFPVAVPGEEDAMARGSVWLQVNSQNGNFLAQCAIGFTGTDVPTGLWPTPDPATLLVLAGGYAYILHTTTPEQTTLLPMRPVTEVHTAEVHTQPDALILIGFHAITVLQPGKQWQSPRLSWEGLSNIAVEGNIVTGLGWHMPSDRELPFTLDLRTQQTTGGAYEP